MEDKNLPYGEEWKLTKNTFTQEGFEFTGWSRTPNGEVEFKDEAKVINLATSGDVNLYAVWRPTCLLSFEIALDNVIKNDSGDSIVIGDDKKTVTKIAIPDNTNLNGYKLAAVAATGHEFLGWKLKNDNGEISESYISNNTDLADYTFSGRKFTVVACFKTVEYKVYVEKLINGKNQIVEQIIPFRGVYTQKFAVEKASFYRLELYRNLIGINMLVSLSNPIYIE